MKQNKEGDQANQQRLPRIYQVLLVQNSIKGGEYTAQ